MMASTTEIVRQEVEHEKEDRRGRVHVSRRVVWHVVKDGELLRTFDTQREAKDFVRKQS